ncbi:MAG: tetrahydrofolate dehydrogenase/cyclohydrolase catalytic domain-containing protein, partial [Bacteroidales bacterium]|nr:tetrahydrofolate dehydrogenase/cyclohydrolase catalytic domain-containing protein [Bacteroidales bacterium]
MTILDGKAVADAIKQEIAKEVETILEKGGKRPHLAAILVGEDGASQTYVGHKEKACKQVGFNSTVLRLPDDIGQDELLEKIAEINSNQDIDGLIVQLPLPAHIDEQKVIDAIDPAKDV